MAAYPALPLFTDAITADCHHLTDAEFGLYTRILILMWRSPGCKIPNDPLWISRKLGRPPEAFMPLIQEFCQSDGNFITQKRLFKEWNWVKKKSRKNTAAAKSRWNKENDACERNATLAMRTQCPPPTPIPKKKEGKEQEYKPSPTNKNTPLPPQPVDKPVGVLKNGKSDLPWDVISKLSELGLAAAKACAPGWDIYHLAGVYNEGVKVRGAPLNPNLAFAAWCRRYTKGKTP